MTNEHITVLTHLKRQHKDELTALKSAASADQYLSQDGKSAQLQQESQRLAAKYAAALESLTARMEYSTGVAMTTASKIIGAIPAPAVADSKQEWERVTMLLEAGAGLNTIVRGADLARLQAIQQWGPTYLEAEAIKTRPGGLAGYDQGADLTEFNTSMRNRFAEILPNGSYLTAGAEAAGVAAEFGRSAQTFTDRLNGQHSSYDPVGEALAAQEAGQIAAANFTGATITGAQS